MYVRICVRTYVFVTLRNVNSRSCQNVNLSSRSKMQVSLIQALHEEVGMTFFCDGEQGGQHGWAFAMYIFGGVKCRTQPMVTL